VAKSAAPPVHWDDFRKREKAFRAWLTEQGAEILQPTNPWEVLRFKSYGATSVLYRNAPGILHWTGECAVAWMCWTNKAPWFATDKTMRRSGKKKTAPVVRTLFTRDGPLCFYCQRAMTDETATIEHLVPRAHGGPNHTSNYVLAHATCNQDAGLLSAMEKIRLHEAALGPQSVQQRAAS
jgi:hypothetical protein